MRCGLLRALLRWWLAGCEDGTLTDMHLCALAWFAYRLWCEVETNVRTWDDHREVLVVLVTSLGLVRLCFPYMRKARFFLTLVVVAGCAHVYLGINGKVDECATHRFKWITLVAMRPGEVADLRAPAEYHEAFKTQNVHGMAVFLNDSCADVQPGQFVGWCPDVTHQMQTLLMAEAHINDQQRDWNVVLQQKATLQNPLRMQRRIACMDLAQTDVVVLDAQTWTQRFYPGNMGSWSVKGFALTQRGARHFRWLFNRDPQLWNSQQPLGAALQYLCQSRWLKCEFLREVF